MKTFNAILEEINATREAIKAAELAQEKLVDSYMAICDIRERRAQKKASEDKICKSETNIQDLKITVEILKNNARVSLFHEVLPVAIEVLQKYNGKPYGEKTREKISAEICEKTGARLYISQRYGSGTYEVYPTFGFGNDYNITIAPKYVDGKQPPLLVDNKVSVCDADAFDLCYISSEYVHDIPGRIANLKKIYAEAAELQEKLRGICSDYNSIAVGNLPQIYAEQRIYNKMAI